MAVVVPVRDRGFIDPGDRSRDSLGVEDVGGSTATASTTAPTARMSEAERHDWECLVMRMHLLRLRYARVCDPTFPTGA